jgi:hypothetical protein
VNARTFQGVKDRSGIDTGVTAGALPDSRLHMVAFGMPATSEFRSCRLSANGRTYPKLARIVRALCAVAGRCRLPLAAAVALTVAANSAQAVR